MFGSFLGVTNTVKFYNFYWCCMCGFMWDIFSFEKFIYTSVDKLAEDILTISKERAAITQERLGEGCVRCCIVGTHVYETLEPCGKNLTSHYFVTLSSIDLLIGALQSGTDE